jgi:Family of unknown function (DUF5681)
VITTKKSPGQWKPGQSGNPKGRKPGTGEVSKMRAAMAVHLPAVLKVLVERALAGDVGAARLLLDRTVAPLKAAEESTPLDLPSGTLTEQGRAVLAAVAAGKLATGQGAALLAALGTLANLMEGDDLARRVAALEARGPSAGGAA